MDPLNLCPMETNRESMFDFLTAAHKESKYEYSENPFSETVHARNFVRVAWGATVDRRSRASHLMESRGQKLGRSLEAIRLHDRRGC